MKTCPTCHQNYENEMKFCLNDGSLLIAETASGMTAASGIDATLHLPGHSTEQPPTVDSPQQTSQHQATLTASGVTPMTGPAAARSNVAYAGPARRSNALMWVGVAVIIAIGAIALALALVITRTRQPAVESAGANANTTASPSEALSRNEPTTSNPGVVPGVSSETATSSESTKKKEQAAPTPRTGIATVIGTGNSAPSNASTNPPPPPPPLATPPRAPISGGVLNGKAIHLVTPTYPPIAKAAHASGAVRVQVLIDENGNVLSASAISGHPLLRQSATNAARASKFTPTKLTGQPVKVSGVIVYNFVAQ